MRHVEELAEPTFGVAFHSKRFKCSCNTWQHVRDAIEKLTLELFLDTLGQKAYRQSDACGMLAKLSCRLAPLHPWQI